MDEKQSAFRRGQLVTIFVIAALFAIGTFQTLTGAKGNVSAEMDQVHLGVSGTYGDAIFVELSTVTEVQLVDSLAFGTCLEGEETGNTVSGIYANEDLGQYTIHAYTDVPAYILVTYPEGILVFNCETDSRTEDFYDRLAAWEPR